MPLVHTAHEREGRDMSARDMSKTYRHMNVFDLLELKSRKLARRRQLERHMSYLDQQEIRRIDFNVKQIDVEIACKIDQLDLPMF